MTVPARGTLTLFVTRLSPDADPGLWSRWRPSPAPVTPWGSSSRGCRSSWGGLGDTQDTWPQLPPCLWDRGSLEPCRCPLSRGWMMLSPPGVSPALDPVGGIAWMETIRLITAHTDEHGGKEMDSRGLSGCGTATWPVWVYRGIKYIRSLTKICSKIWGGNLVWDGWNCAGLKLSVLSDI